MSSDVGSNDWKFGLFGCFGDFRLCCLAVCVPCYVIGKNAEGVGEDCLLYGLLSMLGLNFSPVIRWRLRQAKGIKGSMLKDVLVDACIPCCALIQEGREIGWNTREKIADIGTARAVEPEVERE